MSRGQMPRHRHVGSHRIGWGLSRVKRRGGCRAGPLGAPSGDRAKHPACMTPRSRGAWRCKRGRRGSPRPCGRTAALASAARRNRARGHCRTPTRRSRRMGRQAQRRQGHSRSTCCGSARLAQRGDGSPITTQLPHARPGAASRGPGARSIVPRARDSSEDRQHNDRPNPRLGGRRRWRSAARVRGRASRRLPYRSTPTAACCTTSPRPRSATAWSGCLRSPPGRCRALSSRPEPRVTSRAP